MVRVFLKNTTLCGKILHFVVKHSVLWYNITFLWYNITFLWYSITFCSTFVVYLWYICDIFVVFFAMGNFKMNPSPQKNELPPEKTLTPGKQLKNLEHPDKKLKSLGMS